MDYWKIVLVAALSLVGRTVNNRPFFLPEMERCGNDRVIDRFLVANREITQSFARSEQFFLRREYVVATIMRAVIRRSLSWNA